MPNKNKARKATVQRRLNAINAEQDFITARLKWGVNTALGIPSQSRPVRLNGGRGVAIEQSPVHMQYTATRINKADESRRRVLAADADYWYRAGLKNAAQVRKLVKNSKGKR